MTCAGYPGRDTCAGDSAARRWARATAGRAGRDHEKASASAARAGHPGVYTRVPSIRGWALGQIARTLPGEVREPPDTSLAADARALMTFDRGLLDVDWSRLSAGAREAL